MKTKKMLKVMYLLMAQIILHPGIVFGQDGILDVGFSADGMVTTTFDEVQEQGNAVAIQADQKIVVAGYAFVTSSIDFALCRYNTNGTLDPTFGVGGKVNIDFMGQDDEASSIVMQADGKMIVGGKTFDGTDEDFALIRLNTDGTLDPSFGVMGYVVTDYSGGDESITGLVLQADEKIVASGNIFIGTKDFALARYNSNGTLDNTFDTDGKVTTDFSFSNEVCHGIALQPDGKIVLTGSTYIGMNSDLALVRYNSDGSLDNTFDSDGKVVTDIANDHDAAIDIVVKDGNKLVVVGNTMVAIDKASFAVIQYNLDGTLDNTFDTDGIVITEVQSYTGVGYTEETANKVRIQSDGKIVVGGYTHFNYANYDFALVRLHADGTLDNTFDFDGRLTTNFGGFSGDMIQDIAIQADGKIVAAGLSGISFAVARYAMDDCNLTGSVSVNENLLSADQMGLVYQWLDCDNGFAEITGETAITFLATANGSYAVEINDNGCIDTTTCILINWLGDSESLSEFTISVFPNPANEDVLISANRNIENISIYSINGSLITERRDVNAEEYWIDLGSLVNGVYTIRVFADGQILNYKLIKEQ